MKVQRLVRWIIGHVLALGLVAMTATACTAQDFSPPPNPPAGMIAPAYPPLPYQQPNPGLPVLQPNAGPPPVGPALPEQSPVTAVPSPDSFRLPPSAVPPPGPSPDIPGKGNDAAQSGDWLDFGGRGGMGGFGGGMHPTDSVRYGVIWFPSVRVQGQASDFQMVGQDLSFTHPLWSDPLNALGISAGVRNRIIDTDAILPDTGQAIPSDLWDVHLGLRYSRQLANGWITGGGVSIGSASDHPFATIHEIYVGVNAMLRIPQGEHNAWLFSLMYSPTGELNFPVPGVAFNWNPSPQFHASIGLPLQATWRPTDQWQFEASYMLIQTIHAKAQYRFTEHLSAFAAYDFSNEAYSLLDRPEENDRFFIYDQRVSTGLQASLWRLWRGSASAGYIFDRYMFEGTSFSSAGSNRVNLGAGPFAALNLGVRY